MQRNEGGNRAVVFLVAVLFLNLLLMSSRIVLKNDRSLLMTAVGFVVTPVGVVYNEVSAFFSRNLRHYVFVTNTYQQFRKLKAEHAQLKYENYMLSRELDSLRFRDQVSKKDPRFLAAQLVQLDPNFPFNTILLDRGTMQGVRSGMIVLNESGDLVGRVIDPVHMFACHVRLITSARGGVGACIERDRMEGLITGDNSRLCDFKYLLESLPVVVGDEVVTSGTDGLYPSGISLGRVVEVRKTQLMQEVRVLPHFVTRPLKKMLIIPNATQD
ncbi:MAG: rod shape-determining protein MreC [Acidobacteriota bacterium]|jgi:rod shape-determining protein MreC|nr:rod shape-determining protein MreC [Acidobacteriota bacterium]